VIVKFILLIIFLFSFTINANVIISTDNGKETLKITKAISSVPGSFDITICTHKKHCHKKNQRPVTFAELNNKDITSQRTTKHTQSFSRPNTESLQGFHPELGSILKLDNAIKNNLRIKISSQRYKQLLNQVVLPVTQLTKVNKKVQVFKISINEGEKQNECTVSYFKTKDKCYGVTNRHCFKNTNSSSKIHFLDKELKVKSIKLSIQRDLALIKIDD
jgi:hypothetical protein